ncbi:MAG: hypothetical protein MUD10_00760 [Candidatus Pacebacteria bacterium]|jgi:hypothetical protein|nr:hypothetical protein [Candidatus Paceibacterota bacterium]
MESFETIENEALPEVGAPENPKPEVSAVLERELAESDDEKFIALWRERQKELQKEVQANPEMRFNLPEKYAYRIITIMRQKLVEKFGGKNLEGIDWQGAVDFVREAGLPEAPFIIVDRENEKSDFLKITENIKGYPFEAVSIEESNTEAGKLRPEISNEECGGVYGSGLGMAVVFRRSTDEPIEIEKNLVHELTHGGRVEYSARGRFADNGVIIEGDDLGILMEEGIAGLMEYAFYEKKRGETKKACLAEMFHCDYFDSNNILSIEGQDGGFMPLPLKYLTYVNGNFSYSFSSCSGFIMELIFEAISGFKEKMIEARSMPDGVKIISRILDEYSPGLYSELRQPKCEVVDFAEKLAVVIKKTKGSMEELVAERNKNNDALRTFWEDKFNEEEADLHINIDNAKVHLDNYNNFGKTECLETAASCIAKAGAIMKFPYKFAEKYQEEYKIIKEKIDFYQARQPLTKQSSSAS